MLNWYTSDQNYQNGKINKITKSLTEFFFKYLNFFENVCLRYTILPNQA